MNCPDSARFDRRWARLTVSVETTVSSSDDARQAIADLQAALPPGLTIRGWAVVLDD